MRICLVEDDLELGRSLQSLLQDAGHEVVWVRRATDARYWTAEQQFDAMLLDLGLPDGNGLDLLRSARQHHKQLPILVITARDGIEDRLHGLDSGADDYLVKPFAGVELLARLRAVARRSGLLAAPDEVHEWRIKDLCLDERRMVLVRKNQREDQPINLSKTEFSILLACSSNPTAWSRAASWKPAPCSMPTATHWTCICSICARRSARAISAPCAASVS